MATTNPNIVFSPSPVASSTPPIPKVTQPVQNWRHRISASIGFDTSSFRLLGSQQDLEAAFLACLGCGVTRYASDGVNIAWEGFVNEMLLQLPGMSYQISLDRMGNRMRARFAPIDTSTSPPTVTGPTETTATASDTRSQTRYSIKDMVLSAGEVLQTTAERVRDIALGVYSQPRRAGTFSSSSREVSLSFDCLGWGHMLGWRVRNQIVSSGAQDADAEVADIIADAASSIISRTVLSSNTTQVPRYQDFDRTALDQLQEIASLGDSSGNRWLFQVLEDRVLYYKQASEKVEYVRRVSDAGQFIYSVDQGTPVPYELVRPDRWLRTSDVNIAQMNPETLMDDFQLMYIESVDWSEPDSLQLSGSLGDSPQATIARQSALGERLI